MLKNGGCTYFRIDRNLWYNKSMRTMWRGFTLIEVALFLAVTGALFVGIMVGTQNSIWQQRYNDAVQNYAGFLRNIYAEVSNPQSIGDGRSELAIYGKLITFGQSVGLDGETIGDDEQRIFVYDVVGDASGLGTGSVTAVLRSLGANVVVEEKDDGGAVTKVVPAGIVESYSPVWGSAIETTEKTLTGNNFFEGSILITRHPRSGMISTLVSNNVIEVNEEIDDANYNDNYINIKTLLTSELSSFRVAEVNFCINPEGAGETSTNRRNIRIISNARNASGVEIINLDDAESKCAN